MMGDGWLGLRALVSSCCWGKLEGEDLSGPRTGPDSGRGVFPMYSGGSPGPQHKYMITGQTGPPPFIIEAVEAQRGSVTCLRSHGKRALRARGDPGPHGLYLAHGTVCYPIGLSQASLRGCAMWVR